MSLLHLLPAGKPARKLKVKLAWSRGQGWGEPELASHRHVGRLGRVCECGGALKMAKGLVYSLPETGRGGEKEEGEWNSSCGGGLAVGLCVVRCHGGRVGSREGFGTDRRGGIGFVRGCGSSTFFP